MDLQDRRSERLRAGPDDPDGKLPPGEKGLDEDRLAEGFQEGEADRLQFRTVGDLRGGGYPFPRSLRDRLGEKRKGESNARDLLRGFDDGERGRRDPEVADHPLRHPLVEGEGKQQRIGKRIGNIIGIQERRDLGLAAETPEALGDVEDEIPPFARDKPLRQRADVADPVGLVTEVAQCLFDRRDRLRVVELRRLFLSVSFGEVIVPEVVCYADFHGFIS